MPETKKTALKQALFATIGIFAFAFVCSFLPGTEAYSGAEYYGGVALVAGIVTAGIHIGNALDKR